MQPSAATRTGRAHVRRRQPGIADDMISSRLAESTLTVGDLDFVPRALLGEDGFAGERRCCDAVAQSASGLRTHSDPRGEVTDVFGEERTLRSQRRTADSFRTNWDSQSSSSYGARTNGDDPGARTRTHPTPSESGSLVTRAERRMPCFSRPRPSMRPQSRQGAEMVAPVNATQLIHGGATTCLTPTWGGPLPCRRSAWRHAHRCSVEFVEQFSHARRFPSRSRSARG